MVLFFLLLFILGCQNKDENKNQIQLILLYKLRTGYKAVETACSIKQAFDQVNINKYTAKH